MVEHVRVSDIAQILHDKRPAAALGPGPEWQIWSAIGEAIALLLPENEQDEFRATCQYRDIEPPPPPEPTDWGAAIAATIQRRVDRAARKLALL